MVASKSTRPARLLKISALAKESGVPIATVKHYLREGLLPEPAKRTGRNMSWYDPACVERIRTIKRLQQERFLPLKLIRDVLERVGGDVDDLTMAATISQFVERSSPQMARTRAELVASGVKAEDLDWLKSVGIVTPEGRGDAELYRGDDLSILRVLGASRRVGLAPTMLPTTILGDYARAISQLVRVELEIFRAGVLPLSGERLSELADHAASLSEQLVVAVRRKMMLPVLEQLLAEARKQSGAPKAKKSPVAGARAAPRSDTARRAKAPKGKARKGR